MVVPWEWFLGGINNMSSSRSSYFQKRSLNTSKDFKTCSHWLEMCLLSQKMHKYLPHVFKTFLTMFRILCATHFKSNSVSGAKKVSKWLPHLFKRFRKIALPETNNFSDFWKGNLKSSRYYLIETYYKQTSATQMNYVEI